MLIFLFCQVDSTFPGVVMELSPQEIKEYFTPKNFKIGETVTLFSRRFLLFDCDDFTKAFLWKNFGTKDFTPVDLEAHFTKSTPKMVSSKSLYKPWLKAQSYKN